MKIVKTRRVATKKKARSKKPDAIEVRCAETHNLKSVTCRIPHSRVTVVTGPSGAGKSSLAFDTVYAEGQRRFVESMSTYARQFLDKMERPPVESVDNVLPTVALEAKNSVKNARSTVGTITEVYDVLRLLFTHVGVVHCPNGHGPVRSWSADTVAERLASGQVGSRLTLLVRVPRPKKQANGALIELIRQGFGRRLEKDGSVSRMEPDETWTKKLDPLPLVIGRFTPESGALRIQEAVEQAFAFSGCALEVINQDDKSEFYRPGLVCPDCGQSFRRPTPPLFSFNSPLGACDECQGFGRVMGFDPGRVIPDRSKTLRERPIAPWNSPAYEELYGGLFAACKEAGVSLDVPLEELGAEVDDFLWHGRPDVAADFSYLDRFFAYLERRSYRVHVRVLLSRYRAYTPCPECDGERLIDEARQVLFQSETISKLSGLTIRELKKWLERQSFTERQKEQAGHLFDRLAERVEVLARVGVDYLTLDRQARTLSGGETQRIHLASALGSGLTSTLYVLDEPTIGLHARDSDALLRLLHDLAARGNTVLVVEHDPALIKGADWLIDLGPGAGENGGQLLAEGVPEQVLKHETSKTAKFLGHSPSFQQLRTDVLEETFVESLPRVKILGARENNLTDFDVEFPLGAMVAVTGVSGSGKSTLINNVLHATYKRSQGVVDVDPGECDQVQGLEELQDMILVDQRPLGRSSRSNPVTYIKAYDEMRKLYARQPIAKRDGITPGHFSFNTDKGRCPACEGRGTQEIDMHFMAPVEVVCESCQGRRFQSTVLKVRYKGLDIAQALELTVSQARSFFHEHRALMRRLDTLVAVGLGYLRLGQSTATLSGGEAQRLKLASFLKAQRSKDPVKRRLFLFDEPTTGLHLSDIDQLYGTLRELTQRGDGVVVVEHNLELIARADWIVDLGPGGGDEGGQILYSGPAQAFLQTGSGPTAEYLRAAFGGNREKSEKD